MGVILITTILSLVFLMYKFRNLGSRPSDLPPGPPTLPILGNLHQMPTEKPHLQFKKWADEYGPIYSLILGSSVMIVLNSDKAIKDLLDKRSNIYSDRPAMFIGQRLLSDGCRMLLMEYGEHWRKIRASVHQHLNIKASTSYVPYQDLESRALLVGVLNRPERWPDHLRRYTNSLTTQIVYGFRTADIDDPKMHQLYDGFAQFSECIMSPAARIMDVFPALRDAPEWLMPVKKHARLLHQVEQKLFLGHWLDAKKKVESGTANPCMCTDLANSQNSENLSDKQVAYTSGSLLEAGSDTTYSTLVGFVQAMLLFPSVAQQAQEEIERVCGERLPIIEDEPNMQYLRGCVKESMRWMPTAILGVPHAPIRDDFYEGYRIPKGSSVVYNVWAVHNNPTRFPNPQTFDPTRYATDFQSAATAAQNPDPSLRDHFLFGAGRRLCQGIHIAERSLFLAISRLLWAFDIVPEKDHVTGEPVLPDADNLTEGMVVMPRPFGARFRLRSGARGEAIRREWGAVREKLDKNEEQWLRVPEGMFFKEYIPLKTDADKVA